MKIEKRITAITGHYGCGKTNFALNLALQRRAAGHTVILVDLDLVNPYFRSADHAQLLSSQGIELIAPVYAGTNLDMPAITGRLDAVLHTDCTIILDVGGDDAGAAALGRYSARICACGGCDLLYLVNQYRYLTQTAKDATAILLEIERACRLPVTGIVNTSHCMEQTSAEGIAVSLPFAQTVATTRDVPLLGTVVRKDLMPAVQQLVPDATLYPVCIYVKKPWES